MIPINNVYYNYSTFFRTQTADMMNTQMQCFMEKVINVGLINPLILSLARMVWYVD